jgi:hypothetical protein
MALGNCHGLHVKFQGAFLCNNPARISFRAFGAQKSMESVDFLGPMESTGPIGPGPWPLAVGGRPQQKHVLEKCDVSHPEKWCLMYTSDGIKDQWFNNQASEVHIARYQLRGRRGQSEEDAVPKSQSVTSPSSVSG